MKRIALFLLAGCGAASAKPASSPARDVVHSRNASALVDASAAPVVESAPPAPPAPAEIAHDLASLVASREVQAVVPAKAALRVNVAALRRHRRAKLLRETVTAAIGSDLFDEIEWGAWVGPDLMSGERGFFIVQSIDAIDVSSRIERLAKGTPVKDVKTDGSFPDWKSHPPRDRELAAAHATGAAVPPLGSKLAKAFERMDAWMDDAGEGVADVHVRLRSADPARAATNAELVSAYIQEQNRSIVKMITRNVLAGAKVTVVDDRDVAVDLRATDEQLKRIIELVHGQVAPLPPANP